VGISLERRLQDATSDAVRIVEQNDMGGLDAYELKFAVVAAERLVSILEALAAQSARASVSGVSKS
jgi:hypothetical protein